MRLRRRSALEFLALALIMILAPGTEWRIFAYAADPTGAAVATSLADQETLSITVYNSNLGLVKDTRRLTLPSGVMQLKFGEVAAKIMPQTVHIKSLSDPKHLQILEQNYEYDLLTPQKLLEKFVGKEALGHAPAIGEQQRRDEEQQEQLGVQGDMQTQSGPGEQGADHHLDQRQRDGDEMGTEAGGAHHQQQDQSGIENLHDGLAVRAPRAVPNTGGDAPQGPGDTSTSSCWD